MYFLIKHLHLLAILLSFLLFFSRGLLMMRNSPAVNHRLFVLGPHAVNAVLLLSGVALAVLLNMSPGSQPWLMAKLIALVFYIALGVLTFKHPRLGMRKFFWLVALLIFAFMVSVAHSKNPWGFLAGLS